MNILEVNKSCFKDCFYSFSHTWLHTPFLSDLPVTPPPFPFQIPPLVSVEHCLSFRLSFVISSLNTFFFSFLSLVSRASQHPLTFSSIFFFIFSSFWFLSICSTRTVPPPEPQPRWKLTSFCFRWDHSAPTARERSQTPPPTRSKSFLSGSSYVYVCVCVSLERGGTTAAERSRFFKYDINKRKKAEEEENSYLLVHK